MLAKRIIPCLDVKDGRTVKGVNFLNLRDAGDAVELGNLYAEQGADELVFLDITATVEKRKTLVELVRRVAAEINIPFTVGGVILSVEDVSVLLNAGADKISVNTAAIDNITVVIIDLPAGDVETISGPNLSLQGDDRTVLVNSKRTSGPTRTKVEVLYLGYLVGTRDIDVSGDLQRRLLNPFYDQEAEYSHTTELHIEDDQTIRDEKHTGTLTVAQNNRLTRNSFAGSGTIKIVNELEESRTIFNLTSEHVYRNDTWQDGEQIQDTFEFAGSGRYKFTSVQGAVFDIPLDQFILREQNGELTDYHFSGSGIYSYPPVEGLSRLKYDLLGMDVHDNWDGKAFTCEKYRIETTIEYTINTTKFTFNNVSLIWVVADEEAYDDRSIYVDYVYRYSENALVNW